MKFNVVTLFPEMIEQALSYGVIGSAFSAGKAELQTVNPRDFTEDTHKTVDDRPYGGGDGMIMLAEPLAKSVASLKGKGRVVYLSPHGRVWSDRLARNWAKSETPITLVCGRYGGVDQRFIETFVDEEVSVGDFVLSGGEFAALTVIDSIARHIPGVLGNELSPEEESFALGKLEAPQFTRPREYAGLPVPEALLSGNHKLIKQWREMTSRLKTKRLRPDLRVTASEAREAGEVLATMSAEELRACGLGEIDG